MKHSLLLPGHFLNKVVLGLSKPVASRFALLCLFAFPKFRMQVTEGAWTRPNAGQRNCKASLSYFPGIVKKTGHKPPE